VQGKRSKDFDGASMSGTVASRLRQGCCAAVAAAGLHTPVDCPCSKELNSFVECVVAVVGNHLLHPYETASSSKQFNSSSPLRLCLAQAFHSSCWMSAARPSNTCIDAAYSIYAGTLLLPHAQQSAHLQSAKKTCTKADAWQECWQAASCRGFTTH
jgi:hypothetical protein